MVNVLSFPPKCNSSSQFSYSNIRKAFHAKRKKKNSKMISTETQSFAKHFCLFVSLVYNYTKILAPQAVKFMKVGIRIISPNSSIYSKDSDI